MGGEEVKLVRAAAVAGLPALAIVLAVVTAVLAVFLVVALLLVTAALALASLGSKGQFLLAVGCGLGRRLALVDNKVRVMRAAAAPVVVVAVGATAAR